MDIVKLEWWIRMGIIKIKDLIFEYIRRDEEGNVEGITKAVDDVNLDIKQGDFVAILGHNGSGKSTLAKHMNAILYPSEGSVWVDGKDTQQEENIWDIRQTAGMVFQNPDNQIIGQIVEEDVGFGTSFEKITEAIDEVYSDDGVAIFMDLGSAVMTTEMVLESIEDRKIKMVDCPVTEGAIAAAVVAAGGASLEEVVQVAQASKEQAKF